MTVGDNKRRGLGRGLSALLGEDVVPASDDADRPNIPRTLPVEQLEPSPFQPRRVMAPDELQSLANSIAEKGILQPLLVRSHPDDPARYQIIAGERRWRAAQLAQVHDVPVVIRDFSDREVLEVALVENLQRQDLSPLEEAEGYRRLMDEFGHTQEDVARSVGKSRSQVANMLRLLGLPDPLKTMLEKGELSAGHARALLAASDPEGLARKVVERGLNVRDTERMASAEAGQSERRTRAQAKDPDTLALERNMSSLLGIAVEIRFQGRGGDLVLHYDTLDQLDDILHRLRSGAGGRRGLSEADEAAWNTGQT